MLTKSFALSRHDPTTNRTRFVVKSSAWNKPEAIQVKESPMIELIATDAGRAMRNKNNVPAPYDLRINEKQSEEGTAKFVSPSYIQHNPLIPDGSIGRGGFFAKLTSERPGARVVVHQIIAVGD